MYQLSVPVMNSTVTPETRGEFLRQFQACEVKRVFIVPNTNARLGIVREFDSLKENLAFFEAHGIEGAIWVGETVGHGGLIHDEANKAQLSGTTPMVNFDGEIRPKTNCPLDEDFQNGMEKLFVQLASTGAKLILIDDDFRISLHGKESFCCLCELHRKQINQLVNEELTVEQLRDRIFCGKPNKYRDAYLKVTGDSLRQLARRVRKAVDSVDPTIGLALCSCHCHWDSDGVTPIELTEILKGEHTPVLRLLGAPYWATRGNKMMPSVFEITRMVASFCKDTGFELMTEGDAYPRPCYHVPASFLELHDALIQAEGSFATSFKYMFDYTASPFYEMGYVKRHIRDLPLLKETREFFSEGEQIGVKTVIRPQLLKDSDCDLITPSMNSPYPMAGVLMGYCAIPTTYTGEAICRAAFGQSIQDIPDDDLDGGLVLDAASAILLTERGVDVGLVAGKGLRDSFANTTVFRILRGDENERVMLLNGECRLLVPTLNENAVPMLYRGDTAEKEVLCYRYENAAGQRFLVYLFEGMSLHYNSGLLQGYLVQQVTAQGVEWISKRALVARCQGHPQLYMLCKQKGEKLTVGLFNCHADSIMTPVVTLGKEYQRMTCLSNTNGTLNGNTVTLSEIPAYSWAAFSVEN